MANQNELELQLLKAWRNKAMIAMVMEVMAMPIVLSYPTSFWSNMILLFLDSASSFLIKKQLAVEMSSLKPNRDSCFHRNDQRLLKLHSLVSLALGLVCLGCVLNNSLSDNKISLSENDRVYVVPVQVVVFLFELAKLLRSMLDADMVDDACRKSSHKRLVQQGQGPSQDQGGQPRPGAQQTLYA